MSDDQSDTAPPILTIDIQAPSQNIPSTTPLPFSPVSYTHSRKKSDGNLLGIYSMRSTKSGIQDSMAMIPPSVMSLSSWNSTMIQNSNLLPKSANGISSSNNNLISPTSKLNTVDENSTNIIPPTQHRNSGNLSTSPILIAEGRIMMEQKIGAGAFGDIFLGLILGINEEVAIKRELRTCRFPQLLHEFIIYNMLRNKPHIPTLHWFGTDNMYSMMAIQMLGPSLEDQFNFCLRRLQLKTVLLLADQMLAAIEILHSNDILHRDIKPDNFLIGLKSQNSHHNVYIIDYGLSKRYRDPKTGVHIPFRDDRLLTGTARYASLNTHLGFEQSRRDDLEAIGFVLMYFLRGSLPWQGLKSNNPKVDIGRVKQSTSIETLCENFPPQFVTYLQYCRNLAFEETPNYSYLRSLFREVFNAKGYDSDNFLFDWEELNYKEKTFVHASIPSSERVDRTETLNIDAPPRRLSVTASHRSHHRTASGDAIQTSNSLISPTHSTGGFTESRGRPSLSGSTMMINIIGVNGTSSVKSVHGRGMSFSGDVKIASIETEAEVVVIKNEVERVFTSPDAEKEKNATSCGCFAF